MQHATVLAAAIDTAGYQRLGDIGCFTFVTGHIAVLDDYLSVIDEGLEVDVRVGGRVGHGTSAGSKHIAVVIGHSQWRGSCHEIVVNVEGTYATARNRNRTLSGIGSKGCWHTAQTVSM